LTKDFEDTIQARAQWDPAFRKALLQEGVECLLADDVETGAAVLQDNINATIRFEEMYYVFNNSDKSLMRMFGPKGNPPGEQPIYGDPLLAGPGGYSPGSQSQEGDLWCCVAVFNR